jgi:protease-4
LGPIKVEASPLVVQGELLREKKVPLSEVTVRESTNSTGQRVAVIDLDGLLVNQNLGNPLTIPENPVALFREKLDTISRDPMTKAIVLRINSAGGGVTASDIMRRDLQQFTAKHRIPVVACVMDVGTGGAYYVATAADEIVAHPTSIIGGIGVILNLYNLEDALGMMNIVGVPVKAGKQVDMGSPIRSIPPDTRSILQAIADEFHQRFIETVRASRGGMFDAEEMLDGRVCTASVAQQNHLIDRIGYLDDAITRAEELGNCQGASVILFHRGGDSAKTPYDLLQGLTQQLSLLPNIPGLDRSKLPTFLYIWQPDPALTSHIGG